MPKLYENQQARIDEARGYYVCELRLDEHQRLVFITPDVYLDGELKTPAKTYILGTNQPLMPEFRRSCRAARAVIVRPNVITAFLSAFNTRNIRKSVPGLYVNYSHENEIQRYLDLLPVFDNVLKTSGYVLVDETAGSQTASEIFIDVLIRNFVSENEFRDVGRQPPWPYDDWADNRSPSERDPHPTENDALSDAFQEMLVSTKWLYQGTSDLELESEERQIYGEMMEEIQILVKHLKRNTGVASLRLSFREELHRYEIISGNTFDTMRAFDDINRWMDGGDFRETLLAYLDWRVTPGAERP